ncbi:hypothetical protein M3Y97_00439800 [Aphelenchoides bicaudatus]|nr:hypothetical protein M3Y97_00439800 [Aphelenchoides bicaudatus]
MKRIRAIDVKFRRPVKSTRARLGDSVYFNPGGFVYVKLLLMWISLIMIDFLLGFRLELLWPLWLMIKHLYDAFKVQTFVSSLHYSAFSVFFVCITATSDLICYLFVPVQVLVFIASTYVWIQFVYQSTERGFCTPSFLLWGLFVGFEYAVRSRFDQSTLYLTRGSWVTAGLFSPDGTDNIFVGDSQETLSRFEIYKPFAAHCLGFPIVTLGFRIKNYFKLLALKRHKVDVMKQNELYYRLLTESLPATYDPRLSSKQLALDNADFELDDENVSECGSVITSQPTVCASMALNGAANGIYCTSGPPIPTNTALNRKSRNTAPKSAIVTKSQNGYSATNGAVCTTKRTGRAATGTAPKREQNEEADEQESGKQRPFSFVRLPIYCFWLTNLVCRSAYDFILSPMWRVFASHLSVALKPGKPTATSDDLISNSGDGSLLADEETDREDFGNLKNDSVGSTKRRSKRARGRTPAVAGEIVTSRALSQQQLKPQATIAPSFAAKPIADPTITSSQQLDTCNLHSQAQQNGNLHGQLHDSDRQDIIMQQQNGRVKEKSKSQEKCKCSIKVEELESKLRMERGGARQQLINAEREKEILEQALDIRTELNLVQSQERNQRTELNQLRTKLTDAEQRVTQATRQLDKLKKEATQQKPKQDNARVKREDGRAGTPDQQQTTKELSDMKLKVQSLEKELQATQTELKNRQQAYSKLEQRVKNAEFAPKTSGKDEDGDIKNYQQQIAELQQQNARLEKTFAIDLFRSLNQQKTQLEALTRQKGEAVKVSNGFESSEYNNPPLPSSLVASLANGFGSRSSSPIDRISPSSSSSHSIVASNSGVTKSSTSISDELEQILQSSGQFCYFGSDSFASTATPSTNAAAQALAQQLKMSASPNNLFNGHQKLAQQNNSRSSSPSTNELFSILNAKSVSSSFGSYGLSNGNTASNSKLNGGSISPFH